MNWGPIQTFDFARHSLCADWWPAGTMPTGARQKWPGNLGRKAGASARPLESGFPQSAVKAALEA